MSKKLEELSKDLASGMSRRKAMWRFVAGAGAGLLVGRAARADDDGGHRICRDFCRDEGNRGKDFAACVEHSENCARGKCAMQMNGGAFVCVDVDS